MLLTKIKIYKIETLQVVSIIGIRDPYYDLSLRFGKKCQGTLTEGEDSVGLIIKAPHFVNKGK